MEKNNQTTKNVTKNKEELLSLSDYFFLNETILSILILPFPKESLDRKKNVLQQGLSTKQPNQNIIKQLHCSSLFNEVFSVQFER